MEGRIRWSWKFQRAEEVKDKQRLRFILPVCGETGLICLMASPYLEDLKKRPMPGLKVHAL